MKQKLMSVMLAACTVLAPLGGSAAAQECPDMTQMLIAAVMEKAPCPTDPAKFSRFEKTLLNKISALQNGLRTVGKAFRLRGKIDKKLVGAQLNDYLNQCRASLGSPAPAPTPGGGDNSPPPSAGSLAEVCASVSEIGAGEMLVKSEISDHISNPTDKRSTGYTCVCARLCPRNLSRADFFYENGEYAGSVGYYGRFSGNGQPRLYGAAGAAPQHFVRDIAAKARTIGSGRLYLQISKERSGPATACKAFFPVGRNGSL